MALRIHFYVKVTLSMTPSSLELLGKVREDWKPLQLFRRTVAVDKWFSHPTGRKCHRTRKTAVNSIVIQWHPCSHLPIYNRSRVSTTKARFWPIFWLWMKVWAENPQGTFNLCIKVQEKVKLLKCVTKKYPKIANHPISQRHKVHSHRFKLHSNATNAGDSSTDTPAEVTIISLKTEE